MRPRVECSVTACRKLETRKGLCWRHYGQWLKTGNQQKRGDVNIDKNGPIPDRRPDLGPCWMWVGKLRKDGYGPYKRIYVKHRGPVPEGLDLDHLCRNIQCVNPWHLEAVTRLENIRRGVGHGSETHCPQGHAYTPENTTVRRNRRNCRTCETARTRRKHNAEYWREYRKRRKSATA